MGKIEQKIRNSKLQKTILLTLEMGGLTALAIFAPNVIFALKKIPKSLIKSHMMVDQLIL